MQKIVSYGKGTLAIAYVIVGLFVVAFILCAVLDAPFLVTAIIGVVAWIMYRSVMRGQKKLSKMHLAVICDDRVYITMNDNLEEFHYDEIDEVVLIEDAGYFAGYFKNGIYLIPTKEAIEWRLASKPNRAIKGLYKKHGAIAVIPTFASEVSIDLVYKTLVNSIKAYEAANANCDDNDDDDDALSDFINEVDEVLDAFEEGMDEGERIANRINNIFNR